MITNAKYKIIFYINIYVATHKGYFQGYLDPLLLLLSFQELSDPSM